MADNKSGREDQADDADRRQRERDVLTALERNDETEPPVDERALGELETELDGLTFPATGSEVVAAVGDRTVESDAGTHTVADLVADTDEERFDAPAAVRTRVQRPTVAAAMKRIVERCRSSSSRSGPHSGRPTSRPSGRSRRSTRTTSGSASDRHRRAGGLSPSPDKRRLCDDSVSAVPSASRSSWT